MKKIFLLASILVSAWQVQAQTNNLVVFDQAGEPFYLIVNGTRENNTPQTNVKATGLTGNPVKVKVIFQDTTIPSIDKNAYYQDNGNEETMDVITKKNGEHVLRFVSIVPIPQAPVQAQTTVAPVAPAQPASSTTVVQQTTTTTTTDPNQTTAINMNMGGTGVNMNVNGVQQTTVVTTTTTTTDGNTAAPAAPQTAAPAACVPMSHDDYESAKTSISAKDFENTKLSMAKQITNSNNLTSEQIRGIMKLFTFENSKLDYAKYAYSHCCDKTNYFKVNDVFQFDSSSTELNNYISSH